MGSSASPRMPEVSHVAALAGLGQECAMAFLTGLGSQGDG